MCVRAGREAERRWVGQTMPRSDRSRSPAYRCSIQRISRTIAGFGRYAHKRPPGLKVEDGVLMLDNLMSAWGRAHGLDEEDVMESVQWNIVHGPEGGGDIRLAADIDAWGRIAIRVMPSRSRRYGNEGAQHDRGDRPAGPAVIRGSVVRELQRRSYFRPRPHRIAEEQVQR